MNPTINDWNELLDRADVFIVDTETTGLDEEAELVQLSVLDTRGEPVGSMLFRPQASIAPAAARVHGLTAETLAGAKTFAESYPRIRARMDAAAVLLAWNAPFDQRLFQQTCKRYGLEVPAWPWRCAMSDLQAQLAVDFRPRLEYAAQDAGWEAPQNHHALTDCRMVLHVMRHYAQRRARERPAADYRARAQEYAAQYGDRIGVQWTDEAEVQTRFGRRLLFTGSATPDFWEAWKSAKSELKETGIGVKKTDEGAWTVQLWLKPDQELPPLPRRPSPTPDAPAATFDEYPLDEDYDVY